MKATTSRRMLLIAGVFALLSAGAAAQGYYDDDIYFDASKAKKEKAVKAAESGVAVRTGSSAASVADAQSGSTRNVDEYNRRGSYKPVKETATDLGDNFTYTRRIEQFSNPDIVAASNDDELKYYYNYADDELAGSTGSASPSVINIYVNNPDPWEYMWRSYYYPSAWSWAVRPSYCYYNPWWGYDWWGPSWGCGPVWGSSWGWGWPHHHGPSWSWGWTPGWGGWYPSYAPQKPANRPGWGGPGVSGTHGRPMAGSSVGRRPSGTRPTVTAGTGRNSGRNSGQAVSGRRPGSSRPASGYNPSDATRPGNSSATDSGRTGYNRGGVRRGSSTSTSTTIGRTSGSINSGRTGASSSSSSSSYNPGRSSYNSGRSSYNSGRSSYGGGSSSSGRSGGGSGRSGGGRR